MSIIKYQVGGPTRADSLALLQNTLAYKKYIADKPYIRVPLNPNEFDLHEQAYREVLKSKTHQDEIPGTFKQKGNISSW
jgi:hypothetical protein